MSLPREITSLIVWLLDNLLPPVLRDSRWFMTPLLRIGLGPKYRYFETFRNNAATSSDAEKTRYYELLADAHLQRDTDLSKACIARILEDIQGETVLDIACGGGYLSRLLHEQLGVQVTGADFCPRVTGELTAGLRFIKADISALPFPDAAFDTVVCAHTLEHIVDLERALMELRRVTRHRLILVLPCQRPYRFTFDLHVHFFPYRDSVQLLIKNQTATITRCGTEWYCREDLD